MLGESKKKRETIFILDRKWLCTKLWNLRDENENLNMTLHKVLAIFFRWNVFISTLWKCPRSLPKNSIWMASIYICSSSLFEYCFDVFFLLPNHFVLCRPLTWKNPILYNWKIFGTIILNNFSFFFSVVFLVSWVV